MRKPNDGIPSPAQPDRQSLRRASRRAFSPSPFRISSLDSSFLPGICLSAICLIAICLVGLPAMDVGADDQAPEQATAQPFHVLVVNDDGIDAPGLEALVAAVAADPAYRVTVVAPATPQSAMAHALVIRGEIAVERHADVAGCKAWAVAATPATAARIALSALLADDPPDLVLSGINRGENTGRTSWYSGTVGAAREAYLAGAQAIAFSLQIDWKDPAPDWETAASWAKPIVDMACREGLPTDVILNVNLPTGADGIKGYRLARQGAAPDVENRYVLARQEDGVQYYRARWQPPLTDENGTDNLLLLQGWVVIVPLGIDQTSYPALVEITLPELPNELDTNRADAQ